MKALTEFRSILRQLAEDSIHGGMLKSLALAARLLFFILVVPALAMGELTVYMYISSVALVLAIILIFGLNDELPRIICGEATKASPYLRWSLALNFLVLALLVAVIARPSIFLGTALFAASIVSMRFFGGIVRSVDPAGYERLQTIPWILFVVGAVLLRLDNAFDLVVARAGSIAVLVCVGQYKIWAAASRHPRAAPVSLVDLAGRAMNHGISKLISNLSLIGLMRGPVMLPIWFGYDGDLDGIAFAVAIGEVVVQFGLIPANRAYAAWCRTVPTQSRDWKRAIVLALLLAMALAALAMSAVLLADAFRLLPQQVSSLSVLAQALVLYSIIAGFYALRYLVWARGVLEYWIATVSCVVFLASALIIFAIDSYFWFALIAVATALGVAAIGITSRKYFGSAKSGTAT